MEDLRVLRGLVIACGLVLGTVCCATGLSELNGKAEFIAEMVDRYGFSAAELEELFANATLQRSVLEAISRPAEATLPWYKYRKIFLKRSRVVDGIKFWQLHEEPLTRAEAEFGVPAEIIVAIIGVETFYGKHTGKYKVFDSLATLAFKYPKRAKFFRSELEQYLLLTREQGVSSAGVKGSYAGAMGIPQFIASSYRHYAIDFSGDGKIDLWHNPIDAIGSVANYFSEHGWEAGAPIAMRSVATKGNYEPLLTEGLKLTRIYGDFYMAGVMGEQLLPMDVPAKLLALQEQGGGVELWLILSNFYVITRYNYSILYAMAVYQLAQEIRAGR